MVQCCEKNELHKNVNCTKRCTSKYWNFVSCFDQMIDDYI